MGNTAPHLGLVLTEGFISGYSIENRGLRCGGSNVRGSFVFNARGATLRPRATHRISWAMLWHTGWDDSLHKRERSPASWMSRRAITRPLDSRNQRSQSAHRAPGWKSLRAIRSKSGTGKTAETWLRVNRIADLKKLVRQRVSFIRDWQQIRERGHPLDGAILPYDNALDATFRNPDWSDQKEGRERLGMGVLLALSLQRWRDPKTTAVPCSCTTALFATNYSSPTPLFNENGFIVNYSYSNDTYTITFSPPHTTK